MIEITSGDILQAEAEAFVNTVNCVGVMGRGIALQFNHTDVSWELSDEQIVHVGRATKTNNLVFGIRPEHIAISKEPVGRKVKAIVHLVESLGSVNIIDIFLGEDPKTADFITLRVRTHPAFQVHAGQSVWLDFDEEHVHLFDPQTEQAIC